MSALLLKSTNNLAQATSVPSISQDKVEIKQTLGVTVRGSRNLGKQNVALSHPPPPSPRRWFSSSLTKFQSGRPLYQCMSTLWLSATIHFGKQQDND